MAWLLLLWLTPSAPRVVHQQQSPYTTVFVVDEGDARILRLDSLDSLDQSEVSKADARAVPMEYVRVASASLAFTARKERALVIGTGGGTFPMLLRRHVPAMHIDAVDIDPVVLEVAQRFFGLKPDDHLTLIEADGAAFVRQGAATYDLVLVDAYTGDGIPAHLTTPSFFADVRARVRSGGAAVLNLALDDDEARTLIARFSKELPSCLVLRGRTLENLVVVGVRGPLPASAALPARWRALSETLALPYALHDEVSSVEPCASVSAPR